MTLSATFFARKDDKRSRALTSGITMWIYLIFIFVFREYDKRTLMDYETSYGKFDQSFFKYYTYIRKYKVFVYCVLRILI